MLAKSKDRIAVFDAKSGNKTGATLPKGTIFAYVEQSGTWLRLLNNTWVNGGNVWQYVELIGGSVVPPPPPPPPPVEPPAQTTGAVHVIRTKADGTISVDGLDYE